ncbi:MAG: hypothetical protein QOH71_3595 [Blastocatellia bacterium]|jgi:hypothetical protein|nr:hypothetical protein [Blastocatellia bacterium]
MRKLRQLSMAIVFALMLANGAFAGIIGGGPEPPPEPPSATASGIIGTVPGDAQPEVVATDPIMDVALSLLQSALSLF